MLMDLHNLEQKLNNRFSEYKLYSKEQKVSIIKNKASQKENAVIGIDLIAKMLESSNPLSEFRVKWGIDPTGTDIHIGHIVPVLTLKRLHIFGFSLDIIVGDFTAMIGDPSDRMSERKAHTQDQIRTYAETYFSQLAKVFDINQQNIEKHYNSAWLSEYSLSDLITILQRLNLTSLLQREDFRKRIQAGHSMSVAEILYPIMMGLDSVALKSDIEVGGIDQMLNFHICREVMSSHNMRPEAYITTDLIPGTSGEKNEKGELVKMSKSKGNYIGINENPEDIYGKTMSIPDDTMWIWYDLLTEITGEELGELKKSVTQSENHPKEIKKLLARLITRLLGHSEEEIAKAEAVFESRGEEQVNVKEIIYDNSQKVSAQIATSIMASNNKIFELEKSGAIKIFNNGEFNKTNFEEIQNALDDKGEVSIRVGKLNDIRIKKSSQ